MKKLYSKLSLSTLSFFILLANTPPAKGYPTPNSQLSPKGGSAFNVWINEIHYDNTGTDQGEGVEIAGMAGTDLSCFQIVFYNGANGQSYATLNLSGTIDDEGCGWGAVWFAHQGIQNGAPDGLALVYNPGLCGQSGTVQVVQFLSYEGTFTAANGPAAGMMSVAIPVQETSSTPVGYSLQLQGYGTSYVEFYWASPSLASSGDLNPFQFFCGTPPVVFRISNTCPVTIDTVSESVGLFPPCYWVEALNLQSGSHAVQLILKSTTGSPADIGNFTTQTFIFNPGDGPQPISIIITDDSQPEPFEFFEFALRNPTPGDLIGSDSTFAFHIADNDQNVTPPAPVVWVNEFHYDNVGTDQDEGFEIAGVAGTDLSCFRIILYDQNGQPYGTPIVLSGTVDDEGCGYGALWFPVSNIENGPNDGFALVYSPIQCGYAGSDSVYYFLSYEGPLSAVSGPADGMTAQEIPVSEGTNTPVGQSLQLVGVGTTYPQFTWTGPVLASPGDLNTGQFLCGAPNFPNVTFDPPVVNVSEGAGNVILTLGISQVPALDASGTVVVAATSTATQGIDFTLASQTFTFPAGTTQLALNFPVSLVDDNLNEPLERIVLKITNLNNAISAIDSAVIFIEDNDSLVIGFVSITGQTQENSGTYVAKVVINKPSVEATIVSVSDVPGSAAPPGDYIFSPTTLTWFPFNQDTLYVTVNIVDDLVSEPDESFTLVLSNPTNGASLAISNHTVIIK
ncbi:MAG: hypothetical protein NZM15_01010, partial [Flavobacteriales bacterium]|nr:hypothetical protein [Flavobacteriales bacterium]MDW8431262.1 Calx-beta domain-containing protein [Flavobacteriales bacterium]